VRGWAADGKATGRISLQGSRVHGSSEWDGFRDRSHGNEERSAAAHDDTGRLYGTNRAKGIYASGRVPGGTGQAWMMSSAGRISLAQLVEQDLQFAGRAAEAEQPSTGKRTARRSSGSAPRGAAGADG